VSASVDELVVEPRPAATVVVLRDGQDGPRDAPDPTADDDGLRSAGVHVFPGGAVDRSDTDPGVAARSVRGPDEAAEVLGGDLVPQVALAAHIAAIRELFEEAGVLLADTGPGVTEDQIRAARSALVLGQTTFPEVAEALDLRLRTDQLVPLARWVHSGRVPAPVRYPLLRRDAAIRTRAHIRGWRGDRPPLAAPARRARGDGGGQRSPCGCRRARPSRSSRGRARSRRSASVSCPDDSVPWSSRRSNPTVTRIVMPAGGGVAGQPVCAYLIGRKKFVLIDPGGSDRAGTGQPPSSSSRRPAAGLWPWP